MSVLFNQKKRNKKPLTLLELFIGRKKRSYKKRPLTFLELFTGRKRQQKRWF